MDMGKRLLKNIFVVKLKVIQPHPKCIARSDCNWTRTHNHLVRKRTLNHLAKLASHLNFRFRACFEQGVP